VLVLLGAVVVLAMGVVAPAFAELPTATVSTTVRCSQNGGGYWYTCSSLIISGTDISDELALTLSSQDCSGPAGCSYGQIYFYVYSGGSSAYENSGGTCTIKDAATLVWSDINVNGYGVFSSNNGATLTYDSSKVSPQLSSGTYFFLVQYKPGSVGGTWPAASECEPFTISPPPTVPQFPLGIALLLALAIPGLLLIRTRYAWKDSSLSARSWENTLSITANPSPN